MTDETPRDDARDAQAYRSLKQRAGGLGYATVNTALDALETHQDQPRLAMASEPELKEGELIHKGGHDEDRDGPVPFNG